MPTFNDAVVASSPGIITLAELKEYLGITDTSSDDVLTRIVNGVNAGVVRWLRRDFSAVESVTEYYSGSGQENLYLKHRPLTSLTGVWLDAGGLFGHGDDPFPSSTELTLGVDFVYETLDELESNVSRLISLRGGWLPGRGNIKVTYGYGYSSVPADVKLGTLMIAGVIHAQDGDARPMESEELGDYSYKVLTGSVSTKLVHDVATATGLLKPYREVIL